MRVNLKRRWFGGRRAYGVLAGLALACCTAGCARPEAGGGAVRCAPAEARIAGESATAVDQGAWIVFQSRDGAYWFGTDGRGVYRYADGSLVRFGTEHGLAGNHVRSIQQDRAGRVLVFSDPDGVSRFDGRAFAPMPVEASADATGAWRLHPDDLWFPGGQDTGAVYRYDGERLYRLKFPPTAAGEDFLARFPRAKYPSMKYSPYDVYITYRDSRGHIWFGTATLGVCRYDGKTFAWADKTEVGFPPGDSFGVRSIIEGRQGEFWFSNTLHWYSAALIDSGSTTVGLNPGKGPGVGRGDEPFTVFMSAVKDRHGHIWLATLYGGVWRWDGQKMTHFPVQHDGKRVQLYSICLDNQGTLWLGTPWNGAFRFNGSEFEPFAP